MNKLSSLLLAGSCVVLAPAALATPPQLTLIEPVTREFPLGRGMTVGFELDVDGTPPQGEVLITGGGAQCIATLPETHCVLIPTLSGPFQVTAQYFGDGVHPPISSSAMDYTAATVDMYPYLASVGAGYPPAIEFVQKGGFVLSGDFSQAILSYNADPRPLLPPGELPIRRRFFADLPDGTRRDFIGLDPARSIIGTQDFSTDGRFVVFADMLEVDDEANVRLVLLDRANSVSQLVFEATHTLASTRPPGRATVSDDGRFVAFLWSGQVYLFDSELEVLSLASVDDEALPFNARLYAMSRATGDLLVADETTVYQFSVDSLEAMTWFEAPEPMWNGIDLFLSLAIRFSPSIQTVPFAVSEDLNRFAYVPDDARDSVVFVERETGVVTRWQATPTACRNVTLSMSSDGARLLSNGVSCVESVGSYSYTWLADAEDVGPDLADTDQQCYAQLSRDGSTIARHCFESSGLQLASSADRDFQPVHAGWVGNQSNDQSRNLGITGNGQHVWFSSDATNLTAQPESRRTYVRNIVNSQTYVTHDDLRGVANNGRWAVVETSDADSPCLRVDISSTVVELHRVDTGKRRCVSQSYDGSPVDGDSSMAKIASAGRFVVFLSNASNLVEGDTNDAFDVFRYDRVTGETQRVSIGAPADANPVDRRVRPAISYNGRYIVFAREADRVPVGGDRSALYVRDLISGELSEIPPHPSGYYRGRFRGLNISSNGRYVGYQAHVNIADILPEPFDAKQYDRRSGTTKDVMDLVNTFHVSANGRFAVVEKAPFDNANCGLDELRPCESFALDLRRNIELPLPASWHNPSISGDGSLISYSHRGDDLPYDATLSDDVVVDRNPLFESQ